MAISNFNYARSILKDLDDNKFDFYENGVVIDCTIISKETGECYHVGIGTGAELTRLACISLIELWDKSGRGRFDKFADSIPAVLKRFFANEVRIGNRKSK